MLLRVHDPEHVVEIALVGKYIDLPDAYLSVTEALRAGGFQHNAKVLIRWVASDECQTDAGAQKALGGVDAVLIPGGFGVRGIEGKVGAIRWARERQVPTLGICLGLQCMVIEYARNVAGIDGASSSEFDPQTPAPVIATMEEQKAFVEGAGDLGGTMRLGLYPARLDEGSIIAKAYGVTEVEERHRHRYEVNNSYREPARGVRDGLQRAVPGPRAGGVHRAAVRRAPVFRCHSSASGVPFASTPGPPVVRGTGRGGAGPATG